MVARITDSEMYAHLWGTDELRAVFGERGRLQTWLDILAALAQAQAECDIIPSAAAATITRHATVDQLDLERVAAETRRTSHSTLGIIRGLEEVLPGDVHQFVYYGATVQDITDTWTALCIRATGAVAWRDLRTILRELVALATEHRDLVMAGRTHGQVGSPLTFGLKVASWADEIQRHLTRLRAGRPRWLVGQLAGSTGTLIFFGERGPEVRARFCAKLGLEDPGMSWTTSRDRIVEFTHLLAMIATTLARIGDEVYELQRTEIGELGEPTTADAVGSITMPHKRNPELSEHLVTLARIVRAQAQIVLEGSVQSHERDGRGWKAEWVAFPEASLLTGTALEFACRLLEGLDVDPAAMASNLVKTRGFWASEGTLVALAPRIGKHRAQQLLQDALRSGWDRGLSLQEAVLAHEELREVIDRHDLEQLLVNPATGSAGTMVDNVVEQARRALHSEPQDWT